MVGDLEETVRVRHGANERGNVGAREGEVDRWGNQGLLVAEEIDAVGIRIGYGTVVMPDSTRLQMSARDVEVEQGQRPPRCSRRQWPSLAELVPSGRVAECLHLYYMSALICFYSGLHERNVSEQIVGIDLISAPTISI
jgi:hypothetical protein